MSTRTAVGPRSHWHDRLLDAMPDVMHGGINGGMMTHDYIFNIARKFNKIVVCVHVTEGWATDFQLPQRHIWKHLRLDAPIRAHLR